MTVCSTIMSRTLAFKPKRHALSTPALASEEGDPFHRKVAALAAAAREQAEADREAASAAAEEAAAEAELQRALEALGARSSPETLATTESRGKAAAAAKTPAARAASADQEVQAAKEERRQALSELREVQLRLARDDGDDRDVTSLDRIYGVSGSEAGRQKTRVSSLGTDEAQKTVDTVTVPSVQDTTTVDKRTREGDSSTVDKTYLDATTVNSARYSYDTRDQTYLCSEAGSLGTVVNPFSVLAQTAQDGALILMRDLQRCWDGCWDAEMVADQTLDHILYMLDDDPTARADPEASLAELSSESTASFVPENPSECKLIQSMFMDKTTADVVFVVETPAMRMIAKPPETFHAHRIILERSAPVMAGLCGAGGGDGKATVSITDVDPAVFRLLLGHVYGRRLAPDDLRPKAKELLDAAIKYGVTVLKLEVEVFIVESEPVTMENLRQHLLFAEAKNCALLKEACLDFVASHKVEVLREAPLKDMRADVLADMLAAVARGEGAPQDGGDAYHTMSVNDLRRMAHEKGLDVDKSRGALIAALEKTP